MAPYDGTQQWQHVHSPKVGHHPTPEPRHTTMAPSNGSTSTPPKLVITLPPKHSTPQWHPTMAPSNGSTSTPPKLVITPPPNHGTPQWHPAMAARPLPKVGRHAPPPNIAHHNGTLRWHPAMAARPLPQNWSSPHPRTTAHHNGTQQWQHVHPPKVGHHPTPQT